MQDTHLDKDRHNLLSIGEASEYLGISIDTLRRWEKKEKISAYRSPGGHRYFKINELDNLFGRKYEREKEVLPRITQKKEIEKPAQFENEPTTIPQRTTDIRVVTEREPREVKIPVIQPISIIPQKVESFIPMPEYDTQPQTITKEYVQPQTIPTTIPAPPQVQPQTIPQQKSILEAPNLNNSSPQKEPESKKGLGGNMIVYIIAGIIAILIIAFTIFVIISSNHEVLSPIP